MMDKQKAVLQKLAQIFHIRHRILQQGLSECLGTLVLVTFGCGSVAQMLLSRGSHGRFLSVNLAFGVATTLGILISRQVSGGHLNPTVTFALCLLGRVPWRKFPVYFLFQTLGAFLGAGIIFGMYSGAANQVPDWHPIGSTCEYGPYYYALWAYGQGTLSVEGTNATAGIFATYPSPHLSLLNGFFDQVIGTATLIVCILAIVDPHNTPVPAGLEAFTLGLVVLVIGLSMGFNSGYAVNPARDLGPRLFTALAGWGSGVFTVKGYWFLVPLFAPFLGAVVGVVIYQLMVGYNVEGEARIQGRREEEESLLSTTTINEEA